jgi:hypothetical protein
MTETTPDLPQDDDPDAGPASTPEDPVTNSDKEQAEGDPETVDE